jgi:protease secretion system outer membrane protein
MRAWYRYSFGILFLVNAYVYANDLTLSIESAEKNDPTLAAAFANKDAASENIAITRSKLLPQLGAQGTYQKTNQIYYRDTVSGVNRQETRVNSSNSQLYLRQAIFHLRDWIGLSIGEMQADYGVWKLAAAQSDLWYRVSAAWIDVLISKKIKESTAQTLKSVELSSMQAKRRYKAGESTKDASIEADAQYQQAKAQFIEADIGYKNKLHSYQLLTNTNGENFSKINLPSYKKIKINASSKQDFLDRILDINPDILTAKIGAEINMKRMQQASADHAPSVDLVGSYSRAESDTINTLGLRYNTSQIGVQISIPLFSGGAVSASERQAASTYMASLADKAAAEKRVKDQISSDWLNQEAFYERALASEALVFSAQEQLKATRLGFKSGIKTWSDLAGVELLLNRRETDYYLYIANYLKTQAKLLSTLPISEPIWASWVKSMSDDINK